MKVVCQISNFLKDTYDVNLHVKFRTTKSDENCVMCKRFFRLMSSY